MVIPPNPLLPGVPRIQARPAKTRERGTLATECLFALAFVALATIPLSFAFLQETRTSRAYYHRAALGSLLDGELEVLAAGESRRPAPAPAAPQIHPLDTQLISGLPSGQTWVTREENPRRLTLTWIPAGGRTNATLSRTRVLP